MQMQPQLIMLQKTMMQTEGVCRRLDPEFDMWEISRPIVEKSMQRELGPQGHINDLLRGLNKARRTLEILPDATKDIAALAKAWSKGEIDLTKNKMNIDKSPSYHSWKTMAILSSTIVVVMSGIWLVG